MIKNTAYKNFVLAALLAALIVFLAGVSYLNSNRKSKQQSIWAGKKIHQEGDGYKIQEGKWNPELSKAERCCDTAAKYSLEHLCQLDVTRPPLAQKCNCTHYMLCKMVIVTALDSNFFKGSKDFFGSVYSTFPTAKVIVYNLGLTAEEAKQVGSYCNVLEVRKYNFHMYPNHTRVLAKQTWKPFILKEMSEEFELFFYCDPSCRINRAFSFYLPNLLQFPIILRAPRTRWSILKMTDERMLQYLVPDLDKAYIYDLLPQGFFESSAVVIWSTDYLKETILTPLVDCAMHRDCIAPLGSKQWPCNFTTLGYEYAGCHKEKSAYNLILMKELGPSIADLFQSSNGDSFITVIRLPTKLYDNAMSKECGITYNI